MTALSEDIVTGKTTCLWTNEHELKCGGITQGSKFKSSAVSMYLY